MKTTNDFIKAGVHSEKILTTSSLPSFIWNVDEMKIVNKMSETHEIAEIDGKKIFRVKPGNVLVNAKSYIQLDDFVIDKINTSEGIVIIETDYSEHFRMAFVGRSSNDCADSIKKFYEEKWTKKV